MKDDCNDNIAQNTTFIAKVQDQYFVASSSDDDNNNERIRKRHLLYSSLGNEDDKKNVNMNDKNIKNFIMTHYYQNLLLHIHKN